MKFSRYIALVIVGLLLNTSDAASQDYLAMLESNSYSEFGKYLEEEVDLELFRSKESLKKDAALAKLRERIKAFGPVRWELMHSGAAETTGSNYIIIKTYNKNDEGIRIFLHINAEDGQRKISSIRFRNML